MVSFNILMKTAEIMNVNINRIYYLKKQMENSLKVIFQ